MFELVGLSIAVLFFCLAGRGLVRIKKDLLVALKNKGDRMLYLFLFTVVHVVLAGLYLMVAETILIDMPFRLVEAATGMGAWIRLSLSQSLLVAGWLFIGCVFTSKSVLDKNDTSFIALIKATVLSPIMIFYAYRDFDERLKI